MSRPFSPRGHSSSAGPFYRVNGKIRAREVRVVGHDGHQLGVLTLTDALSLARQHSVDLVEIAANATPPVCRLVDFGKFRYEQAKKEKESKKHQHANRVKEIQLSPTIDPHDFGVKLNHATEFLREDMKVKVTLRFRGREMMHKEFGFQQVNKFIHDLTAYGHPDAAPKLIGKGINVMLSPLPRSKRGKTSAEAAVRSDETQAPPSQNGAPQRPEYPTPPRSEPARVPTNAPSQSSSFGNNPFADLDVKLGSSS